MHKILFVDKCNAQSIPTLPSSDWVLIHIINGSGTIIDNDTSVKTSLKTGDTVCIYPKASFLIGDDTQDFDVYYIAIQNLLLPRVSIAKIEDSASSVFFDIFKQCFYFFYEDLDNAILDTLTEVLISCINNYLQIKRYSAIVEKIYTAILRRFNDTDFDICKILSNYKNKYDYLRRLFTAEVGISPLQLVKKLQIEYAERLIKLTNGMLNVSQVSHQCGIIDCNYFSRMFKTYKGITAKKYIEQARDKCGQPS